MPTAASIIDFAPFRLDLRAGQLCRGNTPLPLRPKTFAVLQHLAEHPGELVTKQALLDGVWGDVAVSEDVVRLSVGELRAALGDQRAAPHFIETVPRRGYRFIARMDAAAGALTLPGTAERPIDDAAATTVVVGRTNERAQVAEWIHLATSGTRQVGFITGEAGIGKTTLVDSTLADLRRTSPTSVRIARGQCVEHYGGGEPYLPLLEAVTSLCRGADRATVETSLREHAPDWLLRVTGLIASHTGHEAEPLASTQEHALHSLAESLEALAIETPLVLVLEDVQWSDYSTLDLLSLVARRRAPARLLVLCTLRPADAIARGHPVAAVKRELLRKDLCREILLGGLSEADVASYLAARFPAAHLPEGLLSLLIDRSDGNPFFLVALVDHLLGHGLLVDSGSGWQLPEIETLHTAIPDGLRAIIEPRLERLAPDERAALEAASVAGPEFAAHAVAHSAHGSSLGNVEYVEQLCDALVRREEILRATGESAWPDGTTSARYAFRHALYQQVIYQNLSASTRRRLHQTIGETLEAAYGTRTEDVASALASHFDRSRDVHRAVRYHGEAAVRARARFAYGESRLHLEATLELMRAQPETADRLQRQVPLLEQLGWILSTLKGWGDEGAARVFAQMRALAERIDGALARFQAMEGQLLVHTMRAEYATARTRGQEMLALAEQLGDRAAMIQALLPIGAALIHLGELQATHDIAERGWSLCDPAAPTIHSTSTCHLLAGACANLGLVAQARAWNREAVALADKADLPYIRANAANFAAAVYQVLRDVPATRALADEAVRITTEHGFSVVRATATILRAWCDLQDGRAAEAIPVLRAGLADYTSTGQRISTTSYILPLVEGYLATGNGAAANEVLDTALAFVAETGERIYEHEIYRLKGECLLTGGATRSEKAEATNYFERAIAIAADQKALLCELRATTSLCRLGGEPARARLARVADRFDAENDCADLRAARELVGRRTVVSVRAHRRPLPVHRAIRRVNPSAVLAGSATLISQSKGESASAHVVER